MGEGKRQISAEEGRDGEEEEEVNYFRSSHSPALGGYSSDFSSSLQVLCKRK